MIWSSSDKAWAFSKSSTHFFLDRRFLMSISAAFALSQKLGAKVFSSSLMISICLASMSKIPPQRTKTLYNTFNLFGICHKLIVFLCKYSMKFWFIALIVMEILFLRTTIFFIYKKATSGALFIKWKKRSSEKRLKWIAGLASNK